MPNKHLRFGGSTMARRIACPGSAQIDVKDIKSEYADEGTKAHEMAANWLSDCKYDERFEDASYEMIDNIKIYVDYAHSLSGLRHVETKVVIKSISDEVGGPADCAVLDWPDCLHIIELKYGAGMLIDPVDNAQMATYALGALETFDSSFSEVWATVVQPRIDHKDGPIRTWKTTPAELMKTWYPKIKKAVEKAAKHPKLYKPGNHCVFCSGARECAKAKTTSKAIVKASEKGEITKDNKKLAQILDSDTMIREYMKLAKIEAQKRILAGEKIPGFKVVRNFGRLTWRDEKEALEAFTRPECWKRKLKTPTQMKKLPINSEEIDKFTYCPDKGLIVVPESDKREAYRGAADDFDDELSEQ
jgi:hypothetical protein